MAKSKIIIDFTSSDISVEIALKKLRVLLANFNNDKLMNWAKCELEGYTKDSEIPSYRVVKGRLVGNLFNGSYKVTNYPLSLNYLSKEETDEILSSKVYQSVSSLESIVSQKTSTYKPIPSNVYAILSKLCGVNAEIVSAHVEFDYTNTQDIISKVNGKVLDTLLMLEKEFGNLDELDIDMSTKNENEIKSIVANIEINLYDNSISIGDNNKIKNSDILTNK